MAGRRWTENDIEALCEMVGKYKIKTIAKRLDRTDLAVINKITKLRLGGGVSNAEGITINKLAQACCVGEGKVRRWIGKGLKAKKCIKYRSGSYTFIKIDDFWRFAFSNKELIDFSKIEKNILGAEPIWVDERRTYDIRNNKKKYTQWTKNDDHTLKKMYKTHTLREIGLALGRTEMAINTRMRVLGIKKRVVIPWTEKEIDLLLSLKKKGLSDEKVGLELGRASGTVNAKYRAVIQSASLNLGGEVNEWIC